MMKKFKIATVILLLVFGICTASRADISQSADIDFGGFLIPEYGLTFKGESIVANSYYENNKGVSLSGSGNVSLVGFDPFDGIYGDGLPVPDTIRSSYAQGISGQNISVSKLYATQANGYDDQLTQLVGSRIERNLEYHADIDNTLELAFGGNANIHIEMVNPALFDAADGLAAFGFEVYKNGSSNFIRRTFWTNYIGMLARVSTEPNDLVKFIDSNSISFDVKAGDDILVRFFSHTQLYSSTVVPEPISSALMLLGGGAMVLRRRYNSIC